MVQQARSKPRQRRPQMKLAGSEEDVEKAQLSQRADPYRTQDVIMCSALVRAAPRYIAEAVYSQKCEL
jgi:hypothetical protein